MEFFKKRTNPEDGMNYYIIPKNTKLYRGDTKMYDTKNPHEPITDHLIGNPVFFGTSIEEVAQYGIVYEFKVNKELHLLALDDEVTLAKLSETISDAKLKKILRVNYGKIRTSFSKDDKAFVSYLCENQYNGYATPKLETDFGGSFHPEILLCDINNVTLIKQITTKSKEINQFIDKQNSLNVAKDLKEKRKKPVKRLSFNNDHDEEEVKPLNRLLFDDDEDDSPMKKGGKSRKLRNKTKSKKHRKRNQRTSNKALSLL